MANTYWQRFLTTEDRFWQKVTRPVDASQCWLWQGVRDRDGYGIFSLTENGGQGRSVRAHRFSYELANDPIPDGMVIDHICRVSACVNPYHLEVVTARENTLRGNTIQAANRRKTHCKRGHALSGNNLRLRTRTDRPGMTERHCHTCSRLHQAEWRDEHREILRLRQAAYRAKIHAKQD